MNRPHSHAIWYGSYSVLLAVLLQLPVAVSLAATGSHSENTTPSDPYSQSTGSWGQRYADQWGLAAVGAIVDHPVTAGLTPITVALIDTGVDYSHPELPASVFWRNPKERFDGQDNDNNGYIDDVIGWDFVNQNNQPWDDHGHGTHLAGIIAASQGNGRGIAGVAANARLMVLKALAGDGFGNGAHIAAAIRYAVDQGARIIQLSLGGEKLSPLETEALHYAIDRQRLVVVAAGNTGKAIAPGGYAAHPGILLVAAATPAQQRAQFADWGPALALLAPGVDVLSLRARGSDFLQRSGPADYQPGSAVVAGSLYRASGNSFAVPWVTAAAAVLLGQRPTLNAVQVRRLLTQNASDLGPPGTDLNHGYGLLNIAAALMADPAFFIEARLEGAQWQPDVGLVFLGTADADRFERATLSWGTGDAPDAWQPLTVLSTPGRQVPLATVNPALFPAPGRVTLRLEVQHHNGRSRVSFLQLDMPALRLPDPSLEAEQ